LDYVEIDAASHTGVDNIREEILDKALYPPTSLKKKIYVIDEVHMLSKWAFNALLKTIEEPRDNVCFILATTEIHKIPDTIISRCQVFNFKKIPNDQIAWHLKNICDQEQSKYTEWALEMMAKMSEGCVRDAVKYVDQVSILWEINEEHITKFLGVASEALIRDFFDIIKSWDRENIFKKIDDIHHQGIDLHQFAKQSLMYIDQNMSDDMDFLLKISEAFTEIISTIRYYPYPSVVYKIAINKYLNGGEESNIPDTQAAVISKPEIKVETTKVEPEEEKIADGVIEESKEEIPNATASEGWNDSGDEGLLEKLINKIDKPSLKSSLQDHIIIDWINDNIVSIVVINKMTHMILEKEENTKYIENIISEILWNPAKINLSFENKEDYFARKLEG
jgi:DNA polymerase III gamma/tau subunit